MELMPITTLDDIKQGDTLIITGDKYVNKPFVVKRVKVSKHDGVEIILVISSNKFFNLGMYLEGRSWVKEVKKII